MSEKIFGSTLTPRAWAFVVPTVVVAVLLVATGLGEQAKFSSRDPARFLLGYGPILLGFLLVALLALALKVNLGRTVSTTRAGLRLAAGGREVFNVRWDRLSYAESDRGVFRVLLLSDGEQFLRLVDLFFRDFRKLREEIYAHDRVLQVQERQEHILG